MFKLTKTAKVFFFVTDPHRKTWRRDLFSYSGIQIELDLNPSSLNYVKKYQLQLSETIDSKEDSEANCREYLTSTYDTCDKGDSHKYFMDNLNCVPPWFVTSGNNSTCQQKISTNQEAAHLNSFHFLETVSVQVGWGGGG